MVGYPSLASCFILNEN